MYILTSDYDYEKLNIISESKEDLQEIALSLFEEDEYEWFCTYNEAEPEYVTFAEILAKATASTKSDSQLYYIEEARILKD